MLLVKHGFAWMTPAIFVIFVVLGGSRSKALASVGRTYTRHFAIFVKTPAFFFGREKSSAFQKHGFSDPDKSCDAPWQSDT